jgi:hypothetical protein
MSKPQIVFFSPQVRVNPPQMFFECTRTPKPQDIEQDFVVPGEIKIQWEMLCKEKAEQERIENEKERERQEENITKIQKGKDFIRTYVASNNLIQLEDHKEACYGLGVSNVCTQYYYDIITEEIVCISEYSTRITGTLQDHDLALKIVAGVEYMNPVTIEGILILSGNVSIYRFSKSSDLDEFCKFKAKNPVREFVLASLP